MTARPAGFPGAERPVPYSLTARAEAELATHEPESGCLLPASALRALDTWTAVRDAPELEAGLWPLRPPAPGPRRCPGKPAAGRSHPTSAQEGTNEHC